MQDKEHRFTLGRVILALSSAQKRCLCGLLSDTHEFASSALPLPNHLVLRTIQDPIAVGLAKAELSDILLSLGIGEFSIPMGFQLLNIPLIH